MSRARFSGALLAIAATSAAAQQRPLQRAVAAPSEYTIDHWNTESGLPQNSVNALLQARDGRLWIATFGGVASFDGSSFSTITTGDLRGLPSDRTTSLALDHDGRIWIGTERGLARYERGAITALTTKDGLPGNHISGVAVGRDGALWFVTFGGALGQVQAGRVRVIVNEGSILGPRADHVLADSNGVIWIATPGGVWRLDSPNAAPKLVETRVAFEPWAVTVDVKDGVWIPVDAGIRRITTRGSRLVTLPRGAPFRGIDIRRLVSTEPGVLWLATGSTIYRFRTDSSSLTLAAGPDSSLTTSMLLDREGALWVGNRISGLARLRRPPFRTIAHEDGLGGNNAAGVFQDSRGRVWVGTKCDEVTVIERGAIRRLPKAQTPFCTWTFAEDHGAIWMAGRGVARWNNGVVRRFDPKDGWPRTGVRALYRDKGGLLWVAGESGVFSWNGKHLTKYADSTRGANTVYGVFLEDHAGGMWVGGTGGLYRVRGDRLERYVADDGATVAGVRAIREDPSGVLWIASYGNGLARINKRELTTFTTRDGLIDNNLSSIIDDGAGFFWFSSDRGVFRLARRELEEYVPNRGVRLHPVTYGRADGMRSAETNGGFQQGIGRTRDGRLWFPTLIGVAVIDPARATNLAPPVLAIDQLSANGRARPLDGPIVVGPGATDVELTYSGVSLTSPGAVAFRYRLDKVDKDWIEAGTRRSVFYSRLSPGSYRFSVMAANRDGVWSAQTATLDFTVEPRFWQTWWFRGVAVLSLAMVPVAYDRRNRRRQRELTRLVDDKTSELRQQKSEIEQQARALEKQNEILAENVRLKDDVERISRHDLRTPLNSIISLAQIVREDQTLPAEHQTSLQLIEQAGFRVMNMANLTLDLYKMEQGVYRLAPRPISIRAVAERVVEDLRPLIRTHDVTVDLTFEGFGSTPSVQGDELLCYSLLSNLVKNAVEAAPTGSAISVRATGGARVRITVHNRGSIPVSLRARLFEKYATADKKGGVGLGAYSARLMAETQGGSITADTSDPDATAIIVELPAGVGDVADTRTGEWRRPSVPIAVRSSEAREILVVDDDGSNRAVLRLYLSQPNWHVDEAENGPLALRMVTAHEYDLVILDIDMPVMDGFQVAEAIRAQEREKPVGSHRTKVVALSSHDDEPTKQRALESGCDQYLTKPASRAAILALVTPDAVPGAATPDADVAALLPAFLVAKKAEVAELSAALKAGDAEQVRRLSHKLRGGFSVYGFASAAAISAEIERLAAPATLANVGAQLPLLYEEMERLTTKHADPTGAETDG